ncbi:universal stress protein [Embleya scabrispora]|uniref:universal stress protein n=1 Tax=Embleya scabrispora TaxID=159449 RepID=UPI00037C0162|nr:universal stress protein [Embleya scabrispora]MYS78880.1 universal stress protein [Streptomyces sp. SID5474]
MTGPVPPPTFELGTDGPRAVPVGVDGSRTSLRVADYALGQARRGGAELVGGYVRAPLGLAATTPEGAEVMEQAHAVRDIADYIARRADEPRVRHRFVEARGDVAHEIAKVADQARADAVVVGASERFGHRLIGSLAIRPVRSARRPVTVIP